MRFIGSSKTRTGWQTKFLCLGFVWKNPGKVWIISSLTIHGLIRIVPMFFRCPMVHQNPCLFFSMSHLLTRKSYFQTDLSFTNPYFNLSYLFSDKPKIKVLHTLSENGFNEWPWRAEGPMESPQKSWTRDTVMWGPWMFTWFEFWLPYKPHKKYSYT